MYPGPGDPKRSPVPGWAWLIFASLPALLVVVGLGLVAATVEGTRNAVAMDGEVVSVERVWSRGANRSGELRYLPVFRYDAPWGEGLTARPRASDDEYGFAVGEIVPILVDPARPERAWVAGAWTLYGDAVGMIGGGGAFLCLIAWAWRRFG